MAKEQIHNYLRTAIILAGVVFAGGGYAMQINSNSKKAVKNAVDIEDIEDDVHSIQLNAKDTHALAKTAAEASQRSVEMFEKIQRQLEEKARVDTAMQIDIGKMQAQMETLTKD